MGKSTANHNLGEISKKAKSVLQEELVTSELRYRSLFESAKDGILILDAETGKIVDVNPFLIDLLGYSKEEFIEKFIWEIGAFQDIIENKDKFLELQQLEYVRYEDLPLETSDGSKILVEFVSNVYLVNNNKVIQCQIHDISARKGKEDTLKVTNRATSDSLNILLNHTHAPLIIWDTSFIIKRFNRKFEQLSGYDAAEVIDKKIDFLFPKDKIAETLELLKNQLADGQDVAEIDILTKDNNIKTVLWDSAPILDEEGKNIIATISQDITSRKLLENTLNITETRYRRLFESAKDGIIILDAETGKIIDVNPFLIELLGYSKKEFIEKFIWEIGSFHDIYENIEKFLELQQKEYVRYDDLLLITSDGREIHVGFVSNVYLASNMKAIQCNIRDNTENWQIKKQIVESEEKFRLITENSADPIFITDKEGKYVYVNKQAVDLLGYSKEELLTFTIADISPKNRIEEYFHVFKQLCAMVSSYSEIELVKKDGSYVDTDLNTILLPNGWIYGSCHDISERKKMVEELVTAKENAEESDRLKSAFLANMSHEIRTPMNGILGFTDLLLEPDLSSEKKESYIKIVHRSGQRMLNTVNDIVEISKIEAGMIQVIEKETDINESVEELTRFFQLEAEKKGLKLSLEMLLPQEKKTLLTDQIKLDSILTNLIKNAIKYTESGTINVGCIQKGTEVEFYIKDTGIGIPAHRQKAVFNRFEQADIADTRVFQGSGLGLAISKSYVEMLGGKIWVESEEGKGSTFYFTLPVKSNLEEKLMVRDEKSSDYERVKSDVKMLKILIADDDETSLNYISLLVNDYSVEILEAGNGNEAVELCRQNKDIDLILMDIQMPGLDGYEATRQIREFNKEAVIIAQTAYAFSEDKKKAIGAGCNDYIAKPIKKDELIALIQKYFRK